MMKNYKIYFDVPISEMPEKCIPFQNTYSVHSNKDPLRITCPPDSFTPPHDLTLMCHLDTICSCKTRDCQLKCKNNNKTGTGSQCHSWNLKDITRNARNSKECDCNDTSTIHYEWKCFRPMEGEYYFPSPLKNPTLYKNPNPSNSDYSTFEADYTLDPKSIQFIKFKDMVERNTKTPLTRDLNNRMMNNNRETSSDVTSYTPSPAYVNPPSPSIPTKTIVYSGSIFTGSYLV